MAPLNIAFNIVVVHGRPAPIRTRIIGTGLKTVQTHRGAFAARDLCCVIGFAFFVRANPSASAARNIVVVIPAKNIDGVAILVYHTAHLRVAAGNHQCVTLGGTELTTEADNAEAETAATVVYAVGTIVCAPRVLDTVDGQATTDQRGTFGFHGIGLPRGVATIPIIRLHTG